MDETAIETLGSWKSKVHQAVSSYEESEKEFLRVCALPPSCGTVNHDADKALAKSMLESASMVVENTSEAYISSLQRCFSEYKKNATAAATFFDHGAIVEQLEGNVMVDADLGLQKAMNMWKVRSLQEEIEELKFYACQREQKIKQKHSIIFLKFDCQDSKIRKNKDCNKRL